MSFPIFYQRTGLIAVLMSVAILTSGQAVPDTSYVYIPANTGFVFTTDVTNTASTGEAAPINNPYILAKTMVTNAQYKTFCTATNHSKPSYWSGGTYPAGKADHPVLQVSLMDAQAYCTWLTTQYSGYTFRVPTEAELENAAKGPNKTTYPWGNSANITYSSGALTSLMNYNGVCSAYYLANFGNNLTTYNNANSSLYNTTAAINTIISINSTGYVTNWINHTNYTGFVYTSVFDSLNNTGGNTTAVYAYPGGKSYYGCYDMAGNGFEWASTTIIAQNGAEAGQTVNAVRGGSWYSTASSAKTSYRGEGRAASGKFATVGFRVAATPATVLPLRLLSFTGKNINGRNELTWQTAQETNVSRYVIERSADSRKYDSIGLVSSNRSSTGNTYRFTDEQPFSNSYYRLKMIDIDGAVTYSPVVFIDNKEGSGIQILYQQETNVIRVPGLLTGDNYSLIIYNTMGQTVSKTAITAGQPVYINHLAKGLYQVVLQHEGQPVAFRKIIR